MPFLLEQKVKLELRLNIHNDFYFILYWFYVFKTLNFFTKAKIGEGVDYMVGNYNLIYPF